MGTNYRVGDLVKVGGCVVRLAAVHSKKVGYHATRNKLAWVFLNKVEPIVIDCAFMERNGFVPCKPSEYCMYEEYGFEYETGAAEPEYAKSKVKDSGNFCLETGRVRVMHTELSYTIKDGSPSPMGFRNTYDGSANYVHELQRVFDMCGVDKKLEA